MPVITSLKPQRNGKRLNIYIDGDFSFGIDLENFVVLGLKVGQELSQIEIEEIIKKAEFQKTLDKLLRFATLRPRSEKEVKSYLKRKEVHESLYEELFNRLNRLELLDDKKFAIWWVDQRQSFKPKSKRILNNELRIKGIDRNIIEETLNKTEINEEKIATHELDKKAYKWEKLPKNEAERKMSDYLLRKGFSWDLVEKIVKKR